MLLPVDGCLPVPQSSSSRSYPCLLPSIASCPVPEIRGFQTPKKFFFDLYTLLYLFVTYFWLHQAFVAACGLSLAVASVIVAHRLRSCDLLAPGCAGFSSCGTGAHWLWLEGPRACRLSCRGLRDRECELSSCGVWAWLS